MNPVRQEHILKDLNFEFVHYLEQEKSISSAYGMMVTKNPYRVLAGNQYNWDENPIGTSGPAIPALTDVSE